MAESSIKVIADYDEACEHVARIHGEGDSNVEEIWLFPDKNRQEIRLVEIDPTTIPQHEALPVFYFGANSMNGVSFRLAIAIIVPKEKGILALPEKWGTWDRAKRIWKRRGKKRSGK